MPRLGYVDGRYLPLGEAAVSVEDRGFQFADGVYEVVAVLNGRLFDWAPHVARLHTSLGELAIRPPVSDGALRRIAERLVRRNRLRSGLLYIQVTRGAAPRDHGFPAAARPTLVLTARPFDYAARWRAAQRGVAVVLVPDERWARPDIKSVSLLPNVLAKQAARSAGAFEAWMVDRDGFITEGGSTNAWIVTASGSIVTRGLSRAILAGVMRAALIEVADGLGVRLEERAFTPAEAQGAAEAFLTSTTNPCLPVTAVGGAAVGSREPGPVTRRLAEALWRRIGEETGWRPPAA